MHSQSRVARSEMVDVPQALARAAACALAEIRGIIEHAEPPRFGRLLRAFEGALDRHVAPGRPPFLPVLLPLLVRGAIDGRPHEAVPVAAASTLLFLSFDLLDDLQDGDERRWWEPLTHPELMLAAAAVPAALPQRFLFASDTPPERAAAMARSLGEGLAAIAEGQAADLAGFDGTDTIPDDAEAAVAGKSGAQMALYARLAALHAGADESEAGQWAAFAAGLGSAGQLASDLLDVTDPEWSRDMAAGARTLPIAFALSRAGSEARADLLALLEAAKTDRDAQLRACEAIRAAGALPYTLIRTQVQLVRARRALDHLEPPAPWREQLERLLDGRTAAMAGVTGSR